LLKVQTTHITGLLVVVLVDQVVLAEVVFQGEVQDQVELPQTVAVAVAAELLIIIPPLTKIELLQTHNLV
tara:strand:- start:201 stop:410 length:210 start_codon:yes stop_codon:yes gene_type:complete